MDSLQGSVLKSQSVSELNSLTLELSSLTLGLNSLTFELNSLTLTLCDLTRIEVVHNVTTQVKPQNRIKALSSTGVWICLERVNDW